MYIYIKGGGKEEVLIIIEIEVDCGVGEYHYE